MTGINSRPTRILLLAVALVGPTAIARAQTPPEGKAFVAVNAGVEGPSLTWDTASSFQLFGESAAIATRQRTAPGPLVSVKVGARISTKLSVAVSLSALREKTAAHATASVPSPIVYSSPTVLDVQESGLTRQETGYHLQIAWAWLSVGGFDVSILGGPSFVRLHQSLLSVSAPATGDTPQASSVSATGLAKGGHVGVEATRRLSRRTSAGITVQYLKASVDLPGAPGVEVGGVQAMAGLAVHF